MRDRVAGRTRLVSLGRDGSPSNDSSFEPPISADGRHVAFFSYASNLVPGTYNPEGDVFVWHRPTGRIRRVSVARGGDVARVESREPSISADGQYVTFTSEAPNLVRGDANDVRDVFVWSRTTEGIRLVSVGRSGRQANDESYWPAVSGDGRHVAFASLASNLVPGATSAAGDVFARDRAGDAIRTAEPPR